MDDVKVYGPLRSGTTDRTLAYAEEILNSETGNKVNVDLRRTKESVDNQLIWH